MKRLGILAACVSLLVCLDAGGAAAADVTGRAGVGGGGGIMSFMSGEQFGEGEPRFIGQFVFKYNVSPRWAAVLESGYGWNSYPVAGDAEFDTLASVVPTTLGLEYRFHKGEGRFWPHLGGGLGLYSLGVKDTYRSWAENPETGERLTWTSPGFFLKAGTDILFENHAAVFVDVLYHGIFSDESDRFDRWGNQNTSFIQLRVGGMYYFALGGSEAVPGDEKEE